jgi:nucleotide-binding universal stress UspA family protein
LLRAKRNAQQRLDEQVGQVEAAGRAIAEAHLSIGAADEEVVGLAEEVGVGLIVVGSRGLGGLKRALMGSVSESIIRHAHCPVLVVRAEDEHATRFFPTKILLATDGSQEAALALRAVVDLANQTDSELHVVYVGRRLSDIGVHAGFQRGYVGHVGPDVGTLPGSQEELDRLDQELLDTEVEQFEAAGGTVAQAHLESGRPEAAIVALGERISAGLIVIGSSGLGGIRRALMGSVSESVVRHAHCPVLVMRREKE